MVIEDRIKAVNRDPDYPLYRELMVSVQQDLTSAVFTPFLEA
jgi:hypothetical protein